MHDNPALTISLALAAGIGAQIVARHLRIPGIVVLLLTGAIVGPEVVGLVQPQSLGGSLHDLVGLSVAVILFEGGLNLNIVHLRHQARVIRRLVTVGAVITAGGATVAAHTILGWSLPLSILFGTLVIVTGPTVITPLLRRVRVVRPLHTILEAEGVLIDPIGAVIAVVALEIVLEQTPGFAARELLGVPSRLAVGAIVGALGGTVIAAALRWERLLPDGFENTFTLALLLALFEISDAIQAESGLLAATVAGLVVGNLHSRAQQELRIFKEQLTVMLVGMLFILLAADVRFADVARLGWRGLLVVVVLMLIVRPIGVLACTWRTGLSWRERAFMAWLSPRGIVAAAVASVFAERLVAAGYPIGSDIRALVFLVIAVTVVVQGLSGRWVASRLGVLLPSEQGYVVAGANALGRAVAAALVDGGEEVVLVDTNPAAVQAARAAGLRASQGNAFDEDVLDEADLDGRRGFLAITPNEGANLLMAHRARRRYRVPTAYVALSRTKTTVSPQRAREVGMRVLFTAPIDLLGWIGALERNEATLERWRYEGEADQQVPPPRDPPEERDEKGFLPLVLRRGNAVLPVDERTVARKNDVLLVLTLGDEPLEGLLGGASWVRAEPSAVQV